MLESARESQRAREPESQKARARELEHSPFLAASQSADLYSVPGGESIAGGAITVVVSVNPLQPLHLLHDLHGVLLNERLV